jgi:hypothetical protein
MAIGMAMVVAPLTTAVMNAVPEAESELRALVHADRLRIADCLAYPLKRRHHILAPVAEPWIQHRREPRERVHHRQNPKLPAGRELIVNEVHSPGLMRLARFFTVFELAKPHYL